jgi:hypothetical protein
VINGFVINKVFIYGRENNEFFKVLGNLFLSNIRGMLTRYKDCMNSDWDKSMSFMGIFNSDLSFGIWSDPRNNFLFSTSIDSFTKS